MSRGLQSHSLIPRDFDTTKFACTLPWPELPPWDTGNDDGNEVDSPTCPCSCRHGDDTEPIPSACLWEQTSQRRYTETDLGAVELIVAHAWHFLPPSVCSNHHSNFCWQICLSETASLHLIVFTTLWKVYNTCRQHPCSCSKTPTSHDPWPRLQVS